MGKNRSDYNVDGKKSIRVVPENYSDLNLDFLLVPGQSDIRPITDISAIRNSIKNLLLTRHGERPFHPEIGSGVADLLFENADPFTGAAIREEVIRTIYRYEPRVTDVDAQIFVDPDKNAFSVTIQFTIKSSEVPTEVSFYLNRIR